MAETESEPLFHLATPLAETGLLNARTLKALEAAGFASAGDLVHHYPRRYEDRAHFDVFPQEESADPACLHGNVVDTSLRRFGRRKQFFEVTLEDPGTFSLGASVVCRWFNMPWIHKVIATGQQLVVYGRPKKSGKRIVIDHPDYEIVAAPTGEDEKEGKYSSVHMGRITPVYPLREGVRQRVLRGAVADLLERIDWSSVDDVLRKPSDDSDFAGLSRARALRTIHFPDDFDALATARRYLALEEFFAMQLNVLLRKRDYAHQSGESHCGEGALLEEFLRSLPFQPTGAQRRAIAELRSDLGAERPMNRLLQGDVGSGKTLVAAAALLLAVEAGFEAALMAPTQILAEQHFLNLQRWFEPLGVRVGLRTGARSDDGGGLPLFDGTADAPPQVVVGTHALIHDGVSFERLGLAVVDEQHKFGVAQRGRLVAQGKVPDVLVMTATPIPRTLTMTIYGDLDVSTLDELPAGRGKVVTAVREAKKVDDVARFLREQLGQGRQAYIVYPLVDESEALSAKAATVEIENWEKRLAPHTCALIHGRIRAEEKEAVMGRFRSGEVEVLVATTVIEVGVDVPNATVMVIFNAERFGLAQLHQLRGRVGRGAHKSYCILLADTKNLAASEKLNVLEQTADGFAVAEADLKIRGPGDVLGTAQSGLPGLRLGDLLTDAALVKLARKLAREVVEEDPDLARPQHAALKPLIERATPVVT